MQVLFAVPVPRASISTDLRHLEVTRTPLSSSTRRIFLKTIATVCLPSLLLPTSHSAISADLSNNYDRFAHEYDALDSPNSILHQILGLKRARADLISRAFGSVLEVGVGTGSNFDYYGKRVRSIVGLDRSERMMEVAKKKIEKGLISVSVPVEFIQGNVEDLSVWSRTFDCIVDTFSLCVFEEPVVALREMKRVLKSSPDARILLLEHVRSDNHALAWYQDVTAEPVARLGKGCYWNQDVLGIAGGAGLSLVNAEKLVGGTVVKAEFRVIE